MFLRSILKEMSLTNTPKCSKPWVLMLLKFVELDFYLPIYSNYSSCCKILNGMPFKQHLLYQGNRFFQLLSPWTNTLCTPHGEWCSPTSAGSPAPHRAAWASTKGWDFDVFFSCPEPQPFSRAKLRHESGHESWKSPRSGRDVTIPGFSSHLTSHVETIPGMFKRFTSAFTGKPWSERHADKQGLRQRFRTDFLKVRI